MANITGLWDKDKPAGTDPINQGDDLLRRHNSVLQNTIEEEHFFTDSTTSAGEHRPGSSRFSYGTHAARTTPTEGRAYYNIADQSLWLTGPSAVTKLAGSQQGGPVRSAVSDTFGWYISSCTSTIFQPQHEYKWVNSSGNPMIFRDGSQRLLCLSVESTGPSALTYPHIVQAWSITSRGVKAIVGRGDQPFGGASAPKFSTIGGANTGLLHIAGMGLISLSEMS